MIANKDNIHRYLSGGTCQYVIPLYQRSYSWETEHCARLWNDIVTIITRPLDGHFVGSIVRITEDAHAGFNRSMIIDGQQRLTTLTLLIVALRDYALAHPGCGVEPEKITQTLLLNPFEKGSNRYRLILTKSDRDALFKKIDGSPIPNGLKSRILDNYAFFSKKIEKKEVKPIELEEAITKLQIADIVLDRRYDDPQAIFESLNSTGMDLKDSDMIRNHILMGLEPALQEEVYNDFWQPVELLFDYERHSELLDNFFRDYLTMKIGQIPKKNDVYKEFRGYHINSTLDIKGLCKDIYRFAKYYADMHFVRGTDAVLKLLYKDMEEIRMEVAYPFLLKVHSDCEDGLITVEELREVVRLCVSYVLRRAVCDIPTNSLNKTFATMYSSIKPEDYLNSVKAFFVQMESYKEFPNDEKFLETFSARDIYSMNKCKYILGRLENWDNKSNVYLDNLTVEHIIPQNSHLSADWINALGKDWKEVQKKYLHTIGNLTLTAYNSEMSDSTFTEKMIMTGGFKESALRLNKYVVSQSTWGEPQVKERAAQLREIAKKAWPYPNLSEAEFAPYRERQEHKLQYMLHVLGFNSINNTGRLFETLDSRILSLSIFIMREFRDSAIVYKEDANFAVVTAGKAVGLYLEVNLKLADVIDPKGLCKEDTSADRICDGDVVVPLYGLDAIDDVMAIVEQAFIEQDVE